LIRATVLHLQTAFVEFAVKEVFKFVLPDKTIPPEPKFMKDLINPLKQAGAFTDFPTEYLENVSKYREVVRNQFAHGDWLELAKEVQNLDIEKAFLGPEDLLLASASSRARYRGPPRPASRLAGGIGSWLGIYGVTLEKPTLGMPTVLRNF